MPDDNDQPVTKAVLLEVLQVFKQELKQELKEELKQELKQEFREELTVALRETELRLREHTESIETKLLTAFHGWASPMAARVRKLEINPATAPLVDERLAALEDRMMAIEMRLVTPPRPPQNQ